MPPKRHLYKVILLGNVGVGKSSMFRRLRDGAAYRHLPIHSTRASANGLDKHTKAFRMSNGESVFLDIWDTAGMEGFRTVTKSYYKCAKVVAMVYDITLCKSFYDLALWMTEVRALVPEAIPVLIGNKHDLESEKDIDQNIVEEYMAANEIKMHFMVSVKDNHGVQEAFEEIAKYLHCETEGIKRPRETSILLHDGDSLPKKSLCSAGSCART